MYSRFTISRKIYRFTNLCLSFRMTSRRFWVLCTEILSRMSLIRYDPRRLLHCPPRNLARKYRNSYEANEELLSRFPFDRTYKDIRRSGVYCLWKAMSEWCKLHVLERWKLYVPMSSSHMEKWPAEGNRFLLSGLPGKKPILL